jgi:hypothetical protein
MGRTECPNLKWITSEPGLVAHSLFYESEMALFPECTESCAQKVVDTADIVRDAIFRHPFEYLRELQPTPPCCSPRLGEARLND